MASDSREMKPRRATCCKRYELKAFFYLVVTVVIRGTSTLGVLAIFTTKHKSEDQPNMNTFCDWLSETIVISDYDSFFRNYISIVLLSFIVLSS